jgi:hypothetical protein
MFEEAGLSGPQAAGVVIGSPTLNSRFLQVQLGASKAAYAI